MAVFYEEDIDWDEAAEVEDVDGVLDGHLKVHEGGHALHRTQHVQGEGGVDRLVGVQGAREAQRC